MRIEDSIGQELMAVASIERDGDCLVIRGRIFGAMPVTARLRPEEARAGLRLMGFRLLPFLLSFPFRRSRRAAA